MAGIFHSTVYFSGHVQGVGFRFTVHDVAKEFEVAGFVQNLPDGRVLLEVEGCKADVEAFVAAVGERMHGYIRKTERSDQTRERVFSGFAIR
jgi:acylphosphatase